MEVCLMFIFPRLQREHPNKEIEIEEETLVSGNEKIFVIDDEEFIRDLSKEILEKYGYIVVMAGDGTEALSIYEKFGKEIDLIILDLVMPGIKGEDLLKKILEINPEAKVIVSSGYPKEERMNKLIELGAVDFIKKPFQLNKLIKLIRKILDESKSKKSN
ncbi:MAG: response regulator [Acidobacteriota bacterium]